MAGLELKYGILKECIRDIQKLPVHYPAVIRNPVSGEGKGITEIEQLADLYAAFYGALERLSEETAKYLNNVMTDFQETDESRVGK